MKKLIKKILKEEFDDFQWVRDVEIKTDLTPSQVVMKYNQFPLEVVGPSISNNFNDIHWEGKRLILYVNHWEDLAELFEDSNSSQYGYITKGLAKLVLAEDDYWEPYYDLVSDWKGQVWDIVTDNDELLEYIKRHIKKHYVVPNNYNPDQLDIFGNKPKEFNIINIDGRILDVDFFNEIIQDNDYLGDLIDDEDVFNELKTELRWAYESSYNGVARDNVFKAAYEALEDILGKGDWTSFKNSRGHTENMLKFDVTGLVLSSVEESINNCIEECRKYFNPERHYDEEEHSSKEEAFEEFCEECENWPFTEYGDFISFYSNHLDNTGDQLSPRFSEWPDHEDLAKYFVEDVYSRI